MSQGRTVSIAWALLLACTSLGCRSSAIDQQMVDQQRATQECLAAIDEKLGQILEAIRGDLRSEIQRAAFVGISPSPTTLSIMAAEKSMRFNAWQADAIVQAMNEWEEKR